MEFLDLKKRKLVTIIDGHIKKDPDYEIANILLENGQYYILIFRLLSKRSRW